MVYRRKQITVEPVYGAEILNGGIDKLPSWVGRAINDGRLSVYKDIIGDNKYLYIKTSASDILKFINTDNILWEENGKIMSETSLGFRVLFELVDEVNLEVVKIYGEKELEEKAECCE